MAAALIFMARGLFLYLIVITGKYCFQGLEKSVSFLKMVLAYARKPASLVFMISGEPKAHDNWFPEELLS